MEFFWYAAVFILGTIIGSFLNVVIYRLHTGRSLGGRSHCLSCGTPLKWYELAPVFSYIFQRARCRRCASIISARYLFVELLAGMSFLVLWVYFRPDSIIFIFNALLVSILIVIAVYDLRHTIIPDELTIFLGISAVLFLGYEYYLSGDLTATMFHIGGGAIAFFFFWGLWYLSKGRWIGLGDAKLSLPLGVIVGLPGALSMVVLAFWIGAILSLTILLLQRLPYAYERLRLFCPSAEVAKYRREFPTSNEEQGKRLRLFCPSAEVAKYRRYFTIKSEVPFAPFLISGFILVHYLHADIFDISVFLFTF